MITPTSPIRFYYNGIFLGTSEQITLLSPPFIPEKSCEDLDVINQSLSSHMDMTITEDLMKSLEAIARLQ